MPEYAQVQTYIICNERSFSVILQHYQTVLDRLGCMHTEMRDWLLHFVWSAEYLSFATKSDTIPSASFLIGKERFQAKLWIVVYPSKNEDTPESWVEFGFLMRLDC